MANKTRRTQFEYPGVPPPAVDPLESNPILDLELPEKNMILCNPLDYGDSNIPMCDSGDAGDILEHMLGAVKYALRYGARPCTFY